MEKVSFIVDGQLITGTLFTPKKLNKINPGIIFLHGMTSCEKGYKDVSQILSKRGIICLTLSIRGHGDSQGDFNKLTVNDGIKDGVKAYNYFTHLPIIDLKRIGISGTSVGAAIASIISSIKPVKSMVLRVPATYSNKMLSLTYQQIMYQENVLFNNIKDISSTLPIRAISSFKGSLLILPSEKDTIIPRTIPQTYFENANLTKQKKLHFILNAPHNLSNTKWKEEYHKLLIEWFTKTL